ncbi:MAG TPA: isochorismatase family protein [Roseiarcus sp.]|nr:isochorismatase family protein [Roseiarcus sp.]
MRLPADATLIVIETLIAQESGAATNIAKLIEAWRAEELPIVHVRAGPPEAGPLSGGREGESIIDSACVGAFAAPELEILLDEIGATTLTLCGDARAVEATAREAADLGFQAFVVSDACHKAEEQARSFAGLHKETATVVGLGEALRAAAASKARQRRDALRPK